MKRFSSRLTKRFKAVALCLVGYWLVAETYESGVCRNDISLSSLCFNSRKGERGCARVCVSESERVLNDEQIRSNVFIEIAWIKTASLWRRSIRISESRIAATTRKKGRGGGGGRGGEGERVVAVHMALHLCMWIVHIHTACTRFMDHRRHFGRQ